MNVDFEDNKREKEERGDLATVKQQLEHLWGMIRASLAQAELKIGDMVMPCSTKANRHDRVDAQILGLG
ncbi:MAG: hypothetical protein Crog4KO_36740 [Crocinitomicaceae bacterium]